MTFRPHHCRMCGRTCCNDCSDKRAIDWNNINTNGFSVDNEGKIDLTVDISKEEQEKEAFIDVSRICEYCEVKLDNTQIDNFY